MKEKLRAHVAMLPLCMCQLDGKLPKKPFIFVRIFIYVFLLHSNLLIDSLLILLLNTNTSIYIALCVDGDAKRVSACIWHSFALGGINYTLAACRLVHQFISICQMRSTTQCAEICVCECKWQSERRRQQKQRERKKLATKRKIHSKKIYKKGAK